VRYFAMLIVCALSTFPAPPAGAQQGGSFRFQEATIVSIHAALAAGQLTCTQLTKLYLDRVAAYNMQGPALRAIITVNPKATEIAAEMDRTYRESAANVGALHCIPVILKDNFNTFDMPTSGGNVSMKASVPPADAFTVGRIRKAGALISPRRTCRNSRAAVCRYRAWAVRCATLTTLAARRAAPAAAPAQRSRRISQCWEPAATPANRYALPLRQTISSAFARPAAS